MLPETEGKEFQAILDTRMLVVALFGMSLAAQALSNHGYMFYSSLFALAVTEKHTFAYGRARLRQREAASITPLSSAFRPAVI